MTRPRLLPVAVRFRIALPGALAAALAAACAGSAPPPGEPAAPPKVAFEPYPAAEVAAATTPHEYRGKALCQRCHFQDLRLTNGPNALCLECHRFGHGNHPVDVVQRKPVEGLPLLAGGAVACHTCHDPHQRKTVLRKPFDELCRSCHGRH